MPRFARLFEAAADTLTAYYQSIAEGNIDSLMSLWIDEEFVSCIRADGAHLHGLDEIRAGFASRFENSTTATMVFATYVMVHDRGEWRIAHIHASPMPDATAAQFAAKLRHGLGHLH